MPLISRFCAPESVRSHDGPSSMSQPSQGIPRRASALASLPEPAKTSAAFRLGGGLLSEEVG
eukprot:3191920-Pyramimonas_sp.AAC.1